MSQLTDSARAVVDGHADQADEPTSLSAGAHGRGEKKARNGAHWLHSLLFGRLSKGAMAVLTLLVIFVLHLASLTLFTHGFLLTRQTLPNRATCPVVAANGGQRPPCDRDPTFSKAIVILIDALRYDFIIPHIGTASESEDLFHHNILTLPAQLHAEHPQRSFLSRFVADPPTTTLQRLKALTTGTLPTFIDAGSNFGGAAIDEDSWLEQAARKGKKIGVLGDDTWLTVFPVGGHPRGLGGTLDLSTGAPVLNANITFPFDSFNVEDLDTVDDGVENNLFRLLKGGPGRRDWDILIGHFLGLDHAGHRFGASHSEVRRKLRQYNETLGRIVSALEPDTLLVVMGDHGMDAKGDHGGESSDEVNAGLWIYSKERPIVFPSEMEHLVRSGVVDKSESYFGGCGFCSGEPDMPDWRSVAQIDLVPTLSLLLGLPIPFNNLGTVIPDMFLPSDVEGTMLGTPRRSHEAAASHPTLSEAVTLNVDQVSAFVDAYLASDAGNDLRPFSPVLSELLNSIGHSSPHAAGFELLSMRLSYLRSVINFTRLIWARFSPELMLAGLLHMLLGIIVVWRFYCLLRERSSDLLTKSDIDTSIEGAFGFGGRLRQTTSSAVVAAFLTASACGTLHHIGERSGLFAHPSSLSLVDAVAFGTCLGIELAVLGPICFNSLRVGRWRPGFETMMGAIVVLTHASMHGGNSFILWEERIMLVFFAAPVLLYFVPSAVAAYVRVSAMSPVYSRSHNSTSRTESVRLLRRTVGFAFCAAASARIANYSTVCREEQHPYCSTTFYGQSDTGMSYKATLPVGLRLGGGSGGGGVASLWTMYTAAAAALLLPSVFRRFVAQAKSDKGVTGILFEGGLRSALLIGTAYWALERVIAMTASSAANSSVMASLDLPGLKTLLARTTLVTVIVGGMGILWMASPLPVAVARSGNVVTVIGFANALGSSYTSWLVYALALAWLVTLPMGQIMLGMTFTAMLCYINMSDSHQDLHTMSEGIHWPEYRSIFQGIVAMTTLGHISFFATGHEAVISSIQWRSAFVGTQVVTYPVSPLLVTLNTLSGPILFALSAPLLVLWNIAPPMTGSRVLPIITAMTRTCVGTMLYHAIVTLGSALVAALLRRHLMVWKVFAPRFMLGGVTLLVVDIVVALVALLSGGLGVAGKAKRSFGSITI